jgi:hypothetical protein
MVGVEIELAMKAKEGSKSMNFCYSMDLDILANFKVKVWVMQTKYWLTLLYQSLLLMGRLIPILNVCGLWASLAR